MSGLEIHCDNISLEILHFYKENWNQQEGNLETYFDIKVRNDESLQPNSWNSYGDMLWKHIIWY
jgi:hypothetical protein